MKRYMVFAADRYYADGGAKDFKDDTSSFNLACAWARTWSGSVGDLKWSHVYDTKTRELVAVYQEGEPIERENWKYW